MAVCPVCGCKTEDIDIVKSSALGKEKNMCSFCERQLNSIVGKEEITEAQLRWLSAVISKDVTQRDEDTFLNLKKLYEKYQEALPTEEKNTLSKGAYNDFSKSGVNCQGNENNKDDIINELSLRVENLEKEIVSMKRKQTIKTILELGIPIILLIIILIVFFSSGLFDALAGVFYEFNN